MRHEAFKLKSFCEILGKRERSSPVWRFGDMTGNSTVMEIIRNSDAIPICDGQDFMLTITVECCPLHDFGLGIPVEDYLASVMTDNEFSAGMCRRKADD